MNARSSTTAFAAALALFVLTDIQGQVRCVKSVEEVHGIVFSSAAAVEQGLKELRTGQTLILDVPKVALGATFLIKASNVELRGRAEGTLVLCPKGGSALTIRGTNVTLRDMEFRKCKDSAVKVLGTKAGSVFRTKGQDSNKQQEVSIPDVHFHDCAFVKNTAYSGAAVYVKNSRLRIADTIFNCNSVEYQGGAIYGARSQLILENSSFAGNGADAENGGAIYVERGSLVVMGSKFENNKCGEGQGGAACAARSVADFVNVTFSGNVAGYEGGAISQTESNVTLNNTVFTENKAEYDGGAVSLEGGRLVSVQAKFIRNLASDNGGAICALSAVVTIERTAFTNNTAEGDETEEGTGGGGAILASGGPKHSLQIRETNFTQNAAVDGGALMLFGTPLTIADSRFAGNAATKLGGALGFAGPAPLSTIVDSYFERNTVNIQGDSHFEMQRETEDPFDKWRAKKRRKSHSSFGGGAVFVQDVRSFKIGDCNFTENRAHEGGAVVINGPSKTTRLGIAGCMFQANEARATGGAVRVNGGGRLILERSEFRGNAANGGGAIYLVADSQLSSYVRTYSPVKGKLSTFRPAKGVLYFQNNSAVRGGAINCYSCVMSLVNHTVFRENVALKQGGAAYIFGAGMDSKIERGTFHQNVASFGGALYLEDCPLLSFGEWGFINLSRNIALDGGSVYLESHGGLVEAYKMENSHFEENQALDLEGIQSTTGIPSLTTWQRRAAETASGSDSAWLHCRDCIYGRGGGLFIGLRNRRAEKSVNLMFQKLEITRNEAVVGGGIYIDHDIGNHDSEIDRWCSVSLPVLDPCLYFAFKAVRVEHNVASVSGGGAFVTTAKNLSSFCIGGRKSASIPCDKNGKSDAIRLRNNKIRRSGGGYGQDLATGAASLEFLNLDKPVTNLKPGDKLVAYRSQEENSLSSTDPGIQLAVRDMLNQTVTAGTPDAGLKVDLVSEWISGRRGYKAEQGIVTVDDTLVAGINRTAELIFRSDDQKNLSVGMSFVILECPAGELHLETGKGCFKCRDTFYSFQPEEKDCLPCEDHAICDGTTVLVPEENFWHWTPFSPVMRRCLVEKACSYKNRNETLKVFYKDYKKVKKELVRLQSYLASERGQSQAEEKSAVELADFFSEYKQCADGYQGVLCGSCSGSYGHASGGICEECPPDLPRTRLLVTVAVLLLFGVITVKVVLEINGVRDDVSFELAQERRALESIIHGAPQRQPSEENALTEVGAEERAQSSSETTRNPAGADPPGTSSTGEGTSMDILSRRRRFQRPGNVEDPLEQGGQDDYNATPSSERMDASASLSDTFNILYNYFQLNTVALSLDVNWPTVLGHFFSVEALLARSLHIEFFPFDCSFADRDNDVGFPNALAALWYRICFPVATIAVYLFTMKVYVFFRRDIRASKHKAGLPSKRLIFLVVYLSCCIDICAELLKVMKCVELRGDVSDDHPYSQYEVVESHSVWVEDTSVVCWRGAHLASVIIAAVGLCICLGVIGFTAGILFVGKRKGLLRNPRFLPSYGFLYLSYRTDGAALYWESVITLRRMLLAGIGVYADHRETSNVQIGFLAFVIFVFVALHEVVKPFDQEDSRTVFPSYAGSLFRIVGADGMARRWVAFNQYTTLNGMEGASLFMSLSLFLAATCINDDKSKEAEIDILLTVCFAVNTVFVLFMLHRLYYGVHHYLDVIAKEKNITFREDALPGVDFETSIPKKLWIIWTAKTDVAEEGTAAAGDIEQQPLLEDTVDEAAGDDIENSPLAEETVDQGVVDDGEIEEPPMEEEIGEENVTDGGNL